MKSPRRPSAWSRARTFVSDYTQGLSGEELRRLVNRDAKGAYSVLMRDREAQVEKVGGLKRFLLEGKLLFLSVSEKLSPRRRLLFGIAIFATALGVINPNLAWSEGVKRVTLGGAPLFFLVAIFSLLCLLAFEMVDRVLVRDEIQIARQLQRELLPKTSPDVPGYRFAHSSRTANDIGGDYFQFQTLPDGRLAIVVADASGHGMAAGLLMAIANATLHMALEIDPAPLSVATLLHRALWRTGDRRSFLTLFYGLLTPATGDLEYVCAGHPFPLVRNVDGSIEEPSLGSFPLGMRETLRPATGHLVLAPGADLLLFTDGLFEAIDRTGQAFGFERLREALSDGGGATEIHDRLLARVEGHVGAEPLADDLTLVVIERLPPEVPSASAPPSKAATRPIPPPFSTAPPPLTPGVASQ
ncbi:MAG: PP2C family protein-serine/threonine phosphatase [Thermoanaerobaculia bacterium]